MSNQADMMPCSPSAPMSCVKVAFWASEPLSTAARVASPTPDGVTMA